MIAQTVRRLPWAIALAAVALWALSPGGWGRAALEGASLPVVLGAVAGQGAGEAGQSTMSEHEAVWVIGPDGNPRLVTPGSAPECEPARTMPEGSAAGVGTPGNQPVPFPPLPATPVTPAPPVLDPAQAQARFRLCAGAEPQAERAIEQLVAGRSFSATLTGSQDGCAELTVTASGQASPGNRQSTNLTVGGGRGVSVRIVTENGATRAAIGPAS